MHAPTGISDPSVKLGVTDEWKEARTVIDNADTQLAALRQYGLTMISALLAAQGLIEFSIKGATQVVPDTVKLAIVIATDFLILGLFDLDLRTRTIQRAAASRAAALEGEPRLTGLISEAYRPHKHITSVDLVYLFFVLATTGLGVAVLAPYPFGITYNYLVLLGVLLLFAAPSAVAVWIYSRPLKGGWEEDVRRRKEQLQKEI
jgi:hypothetical protein